VNQRTLLNATAALLITGLGGHGPSADSVTMRYPVDATVITLGQPLEDAPGWHRDLP
jgi:hypothetical protein